MSHEIRTPLNAIVGFSNSLNDNKNIPEDAKSDVKDILVASDSLLEIVNGVLEYKNDIDRIANKHLKDWTIDRLGKTDQAILRMGIYELVYTDTPEIVAINEAVELANEYSDEKVKSMINAVLDSIYHGENNE